VAAHPQDDCSFNLGLINLTPEGEKAQSAVEKIKNSADREKLQSERLRSMLRAVLATNKFYRDKYAGQGIDQIDSTAELGTLPFTTKSDLVQNQVDHPPFGCDLTYPLENYIRVHQTSGTTGKPMYWLDTEESWNWWASCWKLVFEAAGVSSRDRIYFAFSFGPFIGFWAGWEGARTLGALHGATDPIDYRLRRYGARFHADVRAPHGVGSKKSWYRSRQGFCGKDHHPCRRAWGKYF
jgi:phenylacetate-coenzyme A ligase PaaK-like adenylate-forming protein